MNVLLYAAPLLLFDDEGNEYKGSTFCLVYCSISVGSIWNSIFYPFEYISKAFNLGRVFIHLWSVNVKFVPELVFTSKVFSIALRATHLLLLFFFSQKRWCRHEGGILPAVGLQMGGSLLEHISFNCRFVFYISHLPFNKFVGNLDFTLRNPWKVRPRKTFSHSLSLINPFRTMWFWVRSRQNSGCK
jgi:hypothetical protein